MSNVNITRTDTVKVHRYRYLRVHEAERQTHGNGEQPHEDNLEGDPLPGLVPPELHGVAQAKVAVHTDGTQVHDGGRAEQDVQAYPCQAVD